MGLELVHFDCKAIIWKFRNGYSVVLEYRACLYAG